MRDLYLTSLLLTFILHGVAAQELKINFDYSNAEKTLEYLILEDTTMVEEILSLGTTKTLLKKINMNESEAKYALIAAMDTRSKSDNYQLKSIKKHSSDLSVFLKQIKERENAITKMLTDSLGQYVPEDKNMSITVHFLIGGYSSGFTMGDDHNFYVGLHHYKNDLVSLENTCIHELFHNIQRVNYDMNAIIAKLKEENLGLTYVYAMLGYIYIEGSASYVADLTKLDNKNPHIKELKEHALINQYRKNDVFYLISHMLADAYANPEKVQFDNLYNIIMDWNWNNPGYFVGYTMMKALSDINENSVLEYLKKDPIFFFDTYIRLTRERNDLPKFSDDFEKIVNVIRNKIETPYKN